MTWRLNGVDLDTPAVSVLVLPGSWEGEDPRRTRNTPTQGGPGVWEDLGPDRAARAFTLRFVGPAPDRHRRAAFVLGVLHRGLPWILESPSTGQHRVLGESRFGAFATRSAAVDALEGTRALDVEVEAAVLGVPRWEGGAWTWEHGPAFRFATNDFWTASNASGHLGVPLLGLPEQRDGYPEAVHVTRLLHEQVAGPEYALVAAGDGVAAAAEAYDLSNHAWGRPHSGGDGGPSLVRWNDADRAKTGGAVKPLDVARAHDAFGISDGSALVGRPNAVTLNHVAGPATPGTAEYQLTASGDGATANAFARKYTSTSGRYILEYA